MLLEMLQQESTPEHPLTTAVLCKKLLKIGIKCDRRTLSIDMEALRDFGFDIKSQLDNSLEIYSLKVVPSQLANFNVRALFLAL